MSTLSGENHYAIPRATNIPKIELHAIETLCRTNPVGARGCGEAAAIAGPAATINAICDALAVFGVWHIDMPATLEKIWKAMQTASD